MRPHALLVSAALGVLLVLQPAAKGAGSSQWSLDPLSGDWQLKKNWTPQRVPSAPTDTATFGVSNLTTITNAPATLGAIVFEAGASAYTISPPALGTFEFDGAGITNDSGIRKISSSARAATRRQPSSLSRTARPRAFSRTSSLRPQLRTKYWVGR